MSSALDFERLHDAPDLPRNHGSHPSFRLLGQSGEETNWSFMASYPGRLEAPVAARMLWSMVRREVKSFLTDAVWLESKGDELVFRWVERMLRSDRQEFEGFLEVNQAVASDAVALVWTTNVDSEEQPDGPH